MKRKASEFLSQWALEKNRKPLLIRGARQVGKTYLVEDLAKKFESFVLIDFELEPKYKACFESLHPQEIIDGIAFLNHQMITPGKTLLFLDEIQACPKALTALRYFREKMPELHVIAAGSLLEFAIQHEAISMPVGRIEYLYLYPCTFEEYLEAMEPRNVALLSQLNLQNKPSSVIHEALLASFKTYMITGGMPEALQTYLTEKDLYKVQRVQNMILQTYRDDFGKYATKAQHPHLQMIYDKAPGLVGSQVTFSKIDPDSRSRDLKKAIQLLEYAGLVKQIFASAGSGLPLASTVNDKKFKLQFLDIGLMQRASGLPADFLLSSGMHKLNEGALAEQVVGQLLLAHQDSCSAGLLYFWARDYQNSQAEVDFLMNLEGRILPIEVKSSPNGRLKSLKIFLEERSLPLGIKISAAPLSYEAPVLNVPFYLIGQLRRILKESF